MTPLSLLLVDDHPIFLAGLRRVLELEDGFRVLGEAGSLASAVEQARSLRPDLVLLDLHLPDGSGLEALARIREVAPATRVLVLTGYGAENALPAMRLGACGFIAKLTASAKLLEAIRAVAEGGVWTESPPEGGFRMADFGFEGEEEVESCRNPKDGLADPTSEERLTPREREILLLIGQGKRNGEIAEALHISENTVKTHVSSLSHKLGIPDRLQLTLYAARFHPSD